MLTIEAERAALRPYHPIIMSAPGNLALLEDRSYDTGFDDWVSSACGRSISADSDRISSATRRTASGALLWMYW